MPEPDQPTREDLYAVTCDGCKGEIEDEIAEYETEDGNVFCSETCMQLGKADTV